MKKNIIRSIIVSSLLILIVTSSTEAFTHNQIGNFFQGIRGEIREELDRTRVGRELNRIIEDLEEVAEIEAELGNIIQLVASGTTPIGIASLAVQYGHNPNQLFSRFQERVRSLENNNPAGGGGTGGQLTNRELAAALQSVLEEPPLPQGVYLGSPCIVDLTQCPDESENPTFRHRGEYFLYSCYVEGVVDKKRIDNLNRAACTIHWINTANGNTITFKFPSETQYTRNDPERCARVLLSHEEQRQFLTSRNTVCDQPVAKHDVGDICAVDYTSCPYGLTGQYNSNRVGTINYGRITTPPPRFRREYACEITYGNFALRSSVRDPCATVYVGDIEVNELITSHPEPVLPTQIVQAPISQPQITHSNVVQTTRQMPIISSLADIPLSVRTEEQTPLPVYGQNGIVEVAPQSIQERKYTTKEKLERLGAVHERDVGSIKEAILGKGLPSQLKSVFSDERIELTLVKDYGKDSKLCINLNEGIADEVNNCSKENFQPTIIMRIPEYVLNDIKTINDVSVALKSDKITYEAVGIGKKIKFSVSIFLFKFFA